MRYQLKKYIKGEKPIIEFESDSFDDLIDYFKNKYITKDYGPIVLAGEFHSNYGTMLKHKLRDYIETDLIFTGWAIEIRDKKMIHFLFSDEGVK